MEAPPVQKKTEAFTYERLFELLRAEKNNVNLQKLPPRFHELVGQYLREKEQQIIDSQKSTNIFAADEAENTQSQLRNARRIVRMIYDLREKKITNMALNKSRTSSSLIDTSALMEQEIILFKDLLNVLDMHRHTELLPLVEPHKSVFTEKPQTHKTQEMQSPMAMQKNNSISSKILVRFLDHVPVLVGPDLQEYGPYASEDIASVPSEIGNALIASHKAQELKPQ